MAFLSSLPRVMYIEFNPAMFAGTTLVRPVPRLSFFRS
jgi:hypothetical protein